MITLNSSLVRYLGDILKSRLTQLELTDELNFIENHKKPFSLSIVSV